MGIDAVMLLEIPTIPTSEQIKTWSYHLASAIKPDKFWINNNHGALSIWNGNDSFAPSNPNNSILQINIWSRYYGPDYERGDLLTLCAIAEWCEQNIPNCTVYYGGDSGGFLEPWPDEIRRQFRRHLYTPDKGREYFNEYRPEPPFPPTSDCPHCIPNHRPQRFGWGQNYAKYYCRGCGKYFTSIDNGQSWEISNDR